MNLHYFGGKIGFIAIIAISLVVGMYWTTFGFQSFVHEWIADGENPHLDNWWQHLVCHIDVFGTAFIPTWIVSMLMAIMIMPLKSEE